ncbi:MAG TPA: D-alanyl-D-alanine carboxypeptidase family protein [Sphingomonas sp.]|jgi:D-alanyl-D-alanine carboxypeptidase|nr:D-alanyl-D-alanine carboxypeptidase family protein [Sphingomonas sp.]
MMRGSAGAGRRAFALGGAAAWFVAALTPVLTSTPAAAARLPVSAIVIDADDGRVLYSRDSGIMRRPASLTKMMALYLAFDALDEGRLRLDDRIAVSRNAANQQPSRIGMRPGSTIAVEDAIRAIAVISANDAAVALAEHIAGSEARFAKMMTAQAQRLGMDETSFTNVTGLPGANYSSARDIAALSRALLRAYPRRYGYFGQRSFTWGGRRVANHNHLLGRVAGADGIKTGYTAEAGYALAASAQRGGRRLIAVVIGERTIAERDTLVARLLEDAFDTPGAAPRATPPAPAPSPTPRRRPPLILDLRP